MDDPQNLSNNTKITYLALLGMGVPRRVRTLYKKFFGQGPDPPGYPHSPEISQNILQIMTTSNKSISSPTTAQTIHIMTKVNIAVNESISMRIVYQQCIFEPIYHLIYHLIKTNQHRLYKQQALAAYIFS
jgi:hypothetical protein